MLLLLLYGCFMMENLWVICLLCVGTTLHAMFMNKADENETAQSESFKEISFSNWGEDIAPSFSVYIHCIEKKYCKRTWRQDKKEETRERGEESWRFNTIITLTNWKRDKNQMKQHSQAIDDGGFGWSTLSASPYALQQREQETRQVKSRRSEKSYDKQEES